MRRLGVLLAAGLLIFTVVSCSTKKNEDVSASASSTESKSSDENATSTTEKQSTSTDGDSSEGSSALDDVETCGAVSALTVTLGLGAAFMSDDQKEEVEEQLDELRGKVPDDIQDDIDTIRDGAADADGLVELGQFLDSEEYRDAIGNISEYLQTTCSVDGLTN